MCKAAVTSVAKGLIYAGLKRVSVSWPEVGPQSTAQSRDHRFGHIGVLALQTLYSAGQIGTLEQRGHL
jgi:hypothetical protein